MGKAKSKFIMVLMRSIVSGHNIVTTRPRLADKLEFIKYDPYIQKKSLYREVKKIRNGESVMADPWLEKEDSRNDEKSESISLFDDDFTAVSRLPDSDNYIRSLESRLDKLKCKNRDLSSEDIITSLQAVHHGHVERGDLTDLPVTCSHYSDYESVDINEEISSSYIEKRMFPAKQALTKEEVQALLEADILAKATAAMTAEESHVKDSNSPEALR